MNGKFLLALTGIATAGTLASIAAPASAATFASGSAVNLIGDFRAAGLEEGLEEGSLFTGPLLFGPADVGIADFAGIGEYAVTNFGGASNSGDFAGYNFPNPGEGGILYKGRIQSFRPSDPLPETDFIRLDSTSGLDTPTVPASTFKLLEFVVTSVGNTAFEANGSGFFLSEGDRTPGTFQVTGQGLNLGENEFRGSYSATLTATPVTPVIVPEPTSTLGLLAFGALGGGSWLKKRKQKVAA